MFYTKFLLACLFALPAITTAQQSFVVTQTELDRLNATGYLEPFDYEYMTKYLRDEGKGSVFWLADNLVCWKNPEISKESATVAQRTAAFSTGGLKALQDANIITATNADYVRKLAQSVQFKYASQTEYRELVKLALWLDFFRAPEGPGRTLNVFKAAGVLTPEAIPELDKKQQQHTLTLEDILKGIRYVKPLDLPNSLYPWEKGLAQLNQTLGAMLPGLKTTGCDCAPDTSLLEAADYFVVKGKFYNAYDSMEIPLGNRCILRLALDTLHQTVPFYTEKTDSLNVWQLLSGPAMAQALNQLFADLERPECIMPFNAGQTGVSAYERAVTEKQVDLLPELQLIPPFYPMYFRGTLQQLTDLSTASEKLYLLPGIQDLGTTYNLMLRRNFTFKGLVPLKLKRQAARLLQSLDLLDTIYHNPAQTIQEIEASYLAIPGDVLCKNGVKTHKIDIATGLLFEEEFTERGSPANQVFSYFKSISGGRFNAVNIKMTKESSQKINYTFEVNGHPYDMTALLYKGNPQGYLYLCKQAFDAAQKEGLFPGQQLYLLSKYENTCQLNLLFPLNPADTQRWAAVFGRAPVLVK